MTAEERIKYYNSWNVSDEFPDRVWLDQTGISVPCLIEDKRTARKVIVTVPKPLMHPKTGDQSYLGVKNEIVRYTAHNSAPQHGYYVRYPIFNLILYEY